MWQLALRILVGFLLIIHGFAHWQITTGWGSRSVESSWLLNSLGPSGLHTLGTVLWVGTLVAFGITGILLFVGADWWRVLAVGSSVLSLLVIAIFWQSNMVIGAAVDVGILVALLWVHWPSPQYLGA